MSGYTSDQLLQEFTLLLQSLPNTTNPFPVLEGLLNTAVSPTSRPTGFRPQLLAISAVFGAMLIGLTVALVARLIRDPGSFWLYRINQGPQRYIVPHGVIAWSSAFLIECILVEAFVIVSIREASARNTSDLVFLSTALWAAAWAVTWLAAWSIGVSHLDQLQSSGKGGNSRFTSAIVVNVAAPLLLFLCLATVIPVNVVTYVGAQGGFDQFTAAQSQLGEMAADWKSGDTFSAATLAPLKPTLDKMLYDFKLTVRGYNGIMLSYFLWSAIIAIVLDVIGINRLILIHKSLQQVEMNGEKNAPLRRTWWSLLAVIVLLTGSTCGFCAVTLWAYLSGEAQNFGFTIILIVMYTLIAFGVPTTITLLYMAFRVRRRIRPPTEMTTRRTAPSGVQSRSRQVGEGERSSGVQVTTNMEERIDIDTQLSDMFGKETRTSDVFGKSRYPRKQSRDSEWDSTEKGDSPKDSTGLFNAK
ncbi:hypothetical protein MNV49_000778 [Pseudohyphozyma bogoriensis]|nr:hypothetical protein MNV49_000778 [Pseudohyphozyma bogoriensis]